MTELLFEIYSEEIPARMQKNARDNLKEMFTGKIAEKGLNIGIEVETFVTPTRLVLHVINLPKELPASFKEVKGPRVNAPQNAIDGFLKNYNIELKDLQIIANDKGDFYQLNQTIPAQEIEEVLRNILLDILIDFPWPKSMKWGARREIWVRPLRAILALIDGKILPMEFAGVQSSNKTYGHKFIDNSPKKISNFAEYKEFLLNSKVILSFEDKENLICDNAKAIGAKLNLTVDLDPAIVAENAGLVEAPYLLVGNFDKEFLEVPAEILTTSMKFNQKYFPLYNGKTLAPSFVFVANIEGDSAKIIHGNERVLRARLADAKYFYSHDLKEGVASRNERLKQVRYHEKLGSVYQRTLRISKLAGYLAEVLQEDKIAAQRAGLVCKNDLVSLTVGEFPELQGVMGYYYSLEDTETMVIAEAIRDHYKPLGASDDLPKNNVGSILAIADKFDVMLGLFAINEKPTGSKDPFAIRRAALGVIRIAIERNFDFDLQDLAKQAYVSLQEHTSNLRKFEDVIADLKEFFADRLKFQLKSENIRNDYILAVFKAAREFNLLKIYLRIKAIDMFLQTENGNKILASYKRAFNILTIEEKKDMVQYNFANVAENLLATSEEKQLFSSIKTTNPQIAAKLKSFQYQEAIHYLDNMTDEIGVFFDKVTVNDNDKNLRANRLALLAGVRALIDEIADFSLIVS